MYGTSLKQVREEREVERVKMRENTQFFSPNFFVLTSHSYWGPSLILIFFVLALDSHSEREQLNCANILEISKVLEC